MAKYRHAALIDAESATTAATKTLDLDMTEKISRLSVEFKGTNNGSTPTAHPSKMVSKIELVDGSDVLFSMSATQAEAFNVFDMGNVLYLEENYIDNNNTVTMPCLNFGRYLWDPQLALDPTKFDNLQLKVTHNRASGGSAPDAATLSVFLDTFDEKAISPIGFLQSKEVYSYSLTSSAIETTEVPTDMPLRKLVIQSLADGKQPFEQYNKVKLEENSGQKVIINDIKTSDLLKFMPGNDYFESFFRGSFSTSADDYYTRPTYDNKVVPCAFLADGGFFLTTAPTGPTVPCDATSATEGDYRVCGKSPHGALNIQFGDQDDINDWYDVTKLKALTLKLTAGSSVGSSSTCSVLVQQLRRY